MSLVPERLELGELALLAWEDYQKGNNEAIGDVYDQLLPFCLRICSKTCGRYIYENDEESSIARMALLEAFERYDPDKGDFLVYLAQVIKNRIIDYKRKEKKKSLILSIFHMDKDSSNQLIDEKLVENIIEDLARKQEIERFKYILENFHIKIEDLLNNGPKHIKTREQTREIAITIVEDNEMKAYLLNKKMLPIKTLEDKYGFNRKLIDRYRKHIIANAIVVIYDLSVLKPYVMSQKRGLS